MRSATHKNVLHSLSALYILLSKYYDKCDDDIDNLEFELNSELFSEIID